MVNSVIISRDKFKNSADTITFDIPAGEEKKQGFLIWYEGQFKAYLNQCRHMDVCLDWQPNNFFDENKQYIVCATHGAHYSPITGLCISGPCKGKSLIELKVMERTKDIMIFLD